MRLWKFLFLRSLDRIALPALILLSAASLAHAQLDIPGPMHLTHVEGYVFNDRGKPLVDTEITLVRDERVSYTTHTDQAGAFHFDHISGRYWLRVARTKYSAASREISVEPELVTRLERKKLYVIVGPGACTDECSSVFSNKHEFDKAIREKNRN